MGNLLQQNRGGGLAVHGPNTGETACQIHLIDSALIANTGFGVQLNHAQSLLTGVAVSESIAHGTIGDGSGVWLQNESDATVANCSVEYNDSFGLTLGDDSHAQIRTSRFRQNGGYHVHCLNATAPADLDDAENTFDPDGQGNRTDCTP